MILIRYANKKDVDTIARFNSAMAMETEDKELQSDTIKIGVEKVLGNNKRIKKKNQVIRIPKIG